ncbi:MAG: copper-binding protein [Polaromonas sp.]|nr:copper-binding protein [Polaromonas sp.]
MKNFRSLFLVSAMFAAAGSAYSAGHAGAPMGAGSVTKDMPMTMGESKKDMPMAGGMTEGEIRKVDVEGKKITIKHAEIKNLDMPPMSMVFQVKDPAMLDKVKAGDKVRFKAEKDGSAIVVTEIQPAK